MRRYSQQFPLSAAAPFPAKNGRIHGVSPPSLPQTVSGTFACPRPHPAARRCCLRNSPTFPPPSPVEPIRVIVENGPRPSRFVRWLPWGLLGVSMIFNLSMFGLYSDYVSQTEITEKLVSHRPLAQDKIAVITVSGVIIVGRGLRQAADRRASGRTRTSRRSSSASIRPAARSPAADLHLSPASRAGRGAKDPARRQHGRHTRPAAAITSRWPSGE